MILVDVLRHVHQGQTAAFGTLPIQEFPAAAQNRLADKVRGSGLRLADLATVDLHTLHSSPQVPRVDRQAVPLPLAEFQHFR